MRYAATYATHARVFGFMSRTAGSSNETQDQRTAPGSSCGCELDELTTRKLRIGAGRGSLHRLVRSHCRRRTLEPFLWCRARPSRGKTHERSDVNLLGN